MSDEESTYNTSGLDELSKMISSNKCKAKLGILGDKNARTPEPGEKTVPTNAEVGAAQEFGGKLPARSFLRMPVTQYLDKQIQKPGFFNQKDIDTAIQKKSLRNMIEKIAVAGLAVVLEAFDTGGFGTWAPLSAARIKQRAKLNQGTQILVVPNSHQLRDSQSFEIEETI